MMENYHYHYIEIIGRHFPCQKLFSGSKTVTLIKSDYTALSVVCNKYLIISE